MNAVLTLTGNEAHKLVQFFENTYGDKKVVVHIYEEDTDMDETEYLLSNPANRERILQSAEEIRNGTAVLHTFTLEELKAKFGVE